MAALRQRHLLIEKFQQHGVCNGVLIPSALIFMIQRYPFHEDWHTSPSYPSRGGIMTNGRFSSESDVTSADDVKSSTAYRAELRPCLLFSFDCL